MRFPRLLLVVGLLAIPGCERLRTWVASTGKFKPTTAAAAPKELIQDLSADELAGFCRQRGTLTIVEYYANWNGESMQLIPVLKGITEEYGGRVLIGRINIDTFMEFAKSQMVKSIPDVRFYSDGVLVDRFVGLPDNDEIREKVAAQVAKLPSPTVAIAAPVETQAAPKSVAEPMKKDWLPPGMKRR